MFFYDNNQLFSLRQVIFYGWKKKEFCLNNFFKANSMAHQNSGIETDFTKAIEFNRFGLISMIILVIGCLGGITVGFGAINYTVTLVMVVIPTMTTLSLLLAVAPMRWIVISGLSSIAIDVILLVYFLLIG